MKRIAIFIALAAITATIFAAPKSDVEGNKNVTTEDRQVSDFTAVSVSSGIDLYLTQGNKETLKLEADENLMEHIITEVENGVLKIYSKKNLRKYKKLEAHLTFKELDKISGSAGADVFAEKRIKADKMYVNMSSGSDIKLKLKAPKIRLNMSSGSDGIVDFEGKSVKINASSGSDVEMLASNLDDFTANISSGSDIMIQGSAQIVNINASSGSDMDAFDFTVANATIDASSASDIDITVMGKLTVNASSGSSVSYKGDAKMTHLNTSSLGTVRKL